VVLAVLWEAVARYQDNDLLLPSFLQTAAALWDGLLSGELPAKVGVSLVVLLKGYLLGIVLAFGLTSLAVSTQLGRDLLGTLTSMFNPLPAIALLPLALAVVRPGRQQPDLRAGAFGAVGAGAEHLRGLSRRLKPCAWPGATMA
jgi:ABC-type nitrate/sulfonate/bicarbonate transport system permease component